ncbi:Tat pathway signal protein [Synechococcus sp. YX-04-1]|uniref:Tat pathway signal protein n=1 Tax=Synechococcus sp. YX-04-1 TaxID=3062778 RepID=UPI0026E47D4F|nr:Tat pathway signal protein [Synechococcus sp. YX-04-1]MDO6352897.1 Tat pathway signal protein [Synechococcus sp. YX-04-1]
MTVFSLTCSSCGTPVEIPGRYGFKLKSAGITNTVCTRCRQGTFLASRRDNISGQIAVGPSPDQRRLIPLAAAVAALALLIGGIVWRSAVPTAQEALPVSESPSR